MASPRKQNELTYPYLSFGSFLVAIVIYLINKESNWSFFFYLLAFIISILVIIKERPGKTKNFAVFNIIFFIVSVLIIAVVLNKS
jgi:hypothetical protein